MNLKDPNVCLLTKDFSTAFGALDSTAAAESSILESLRYSADGNLSNNQRRGVLGGSAMLTVTGGASQGCSASSAAVGRFDGSLMRACMKG